jgi:DHA1 family bicyclomycin/chloramphenicol resistance-like MFS transporter
MLALAAAVNFSSLACFIGSAPAIIEHHWHLDETSYWQLFLPVIGGILTGAIVSTRVAGRMDLLKQVRMGFGLTFAASAIRVLMHLALDNPPRGLQQAILFFGAIGAQFAFPVLTLRMLDLFPAARGTAAAAQSFVALVITAFTLGVVAPFVLPELEWIAWTSLIFTSLASVFWVFARRWHDRTIPHAPVS